MDRRKDTAAYASLPLSTMSKSKAHIPLKGTQTEPQDNQAALASRPIPQSPSAQAHQNRAADGPDLGPRSAAVNRVQDSFLKLSRSRSSPRASRGKVIPFAKTAMFLR